MLGVGVENNRYYRQYAPTPAMESLAKTWQANKQKVKAQKRQQSPVINAPLIQQIHDAGPSL